ncbi:DUF4838 domain-containing protein [Chitinophaga lutea]|uniref:DUF4838 domain-containing protein n=1 Tax=Chitinophaga lutea TaxID=2488634 RepID=A0A3N4QBE7_9BACT|nr:DUF4838 domain-containing protein [Chitinophaga lutea]RPE13297.1 DUF4838 domain-containing protein [Chitinophaga lutea]
MKPLLSICCLLAASFPGHCGDITLVAGGRSDYHISLAPDAGAHGKKAAAVLMRYVEAVSGVKLAVKEEAAAGEKSLRVTYDKNMQPERFRINVEGTSLVITGGPGKGVLYGAYAFVEQLLGCRKWDGGPAYTPSKNTVVVPGNVRVNEAPAFRYREVYMPAACTDAEYLDWHRLHRFEDLWGLWGHSFNKLVPAGTYFKQHPEYFSLVNGTRKATQLCLSNEAVFDITVAALKQRMTEQPDALYWSISPNDDVGYCECDRCAAVDKREGGPQGSLVQFVNKVAARFPDKIFTTLAYTYSAQPTLHLRPAPNVYVMLSNIEVYRSRPLDRESSAAAFRSRLNGWYAKTPNIFIWDYCTQFTNYLTIFPNIATLQPNMQFLKKQQVAGVFEQGSGYTYSELAELKGHLAARLLWSPDADVEQLKSEFLTGYYGRAAGPIIEYLALLDQAAALQPKLDIYGNPVNEYNTFLSPMHMDKYSQLLDKAEAAVEGNATLHERVERIRLTQEYVYLQQARFYGIEQHGIFERQGNGWIVRPGLADRIRRFTANSKAAGVKELSEGGPSPDAYAKEWEKILADGVRSNKALRATVHLQSAPAPEYPAKGPQTLTDGNPGYTDFSYNWLCFYGEPLSAVVDLGKPVAFTNVSLTFLEDARHWIFRPSKMQVWVSDDGKNYRSLGVVNNVMPEEDYTVQRLQYRFDHKGGGSARYLKLTADNWPQLPEWRFRAHKKAMIACDEVWVE